MGISVYDFVPDGASGGNLFPEEIDADPWIMFHGTSRFNAESIERYGFAYRPDDLISVEQLQRVYKIYESMKWTGQSLGGCPVLKPFSIDHDFIENKQGVSFFAETSYRALIYAGSDFAGGEKLRALRYAFFDLHSYLHDPEVRELHQAAMERHFRTLITINAQPSEIDDARPTAIDLEWLRSELAATKDIRDIADNALQRHDGGVVYALRMETDDLAGLRWNASMGIEAMRSIPSSKIVSKVMVPGHCDSESFMHNGANYLARMNFGLLAALTALSR